MKVDNIDKNVPNLFWFFCDFVASLSLKPTVIGKLGRQVSANKIPEILK